MLAELIKIDTPIVILDIGSVDVEGEKINYHKLFDQLPCHVIGFDPNEEQKKKYIKKTGQHAHLIEKYPDVIGDGEVHEFNECSLSTCSSLLEPNFTIADNFQAFSEFMQISKQYSVQTKKLDEVMSGKTIDYVKLDVQGAELMVLESARTVLQSAVIVESEVEFIQQYKHQPLFSDIESYLRKQHYLFHTFTGYGSRCLKPYKTHHVFAGLRQWLWADAVFVKNILLDNDNLSVDKLKKMACIADIVYGSFDYALRCLMKIDHLEGSNYAKIYLAHKEKHN